MTPEDVLADLNERVSRLARLATGQGDPLDLVAALLPTVPEASAASAARGVATQAARVVELADVHGADGLERARRLGFVAALAATARHLDRPGAWLDLVDDAHHDVLGRPHAWRDLSTTALSLELVLELPEASPARALLHLVARAALDAAPPEALARADHLLRRARTRARVARWKTWLDGHAPSVAPGLAPALDAVASASLPMAASDGPPDALARVVLGAAYGGEVTLAVSPGGAVLEWDGDGEAPEAALVDGRALEPSEASLACCAWALDVPPEGPLRVELRGSTGKTHLDWGSP